LAAALSKRYCAPAAERIGLCSSATRALSPSVDCGCIRSRRELVLLPGVLPVFSANTAQSEKLIVILAAQPPLFPIRTGGVLRSLESAWFNELVKRLSGETFSQRVSVGQSPQAHPAIRVGAQRLAQYNGSELFGWKTSAPNLPNG